MKLFSFKTQIGGAKNDLFSRYFFCQFFCLIPECSRLIFCFHLKFGQAILVRVLMLNF